MPTVKFKPLPERFRENVARILREKDMLQIDLADLMDCHKSQVSHVLSGRQIPTLDAVDRWSRALRVDPVALLANEGSDVLLEPTFSIDEICELINVSRNKLKKMRENEEIPAPIWTEDRRVRWSETTIKRWESLGFPSREEFEAIKLSSDNFSW